LRIEIEAELTILIIRFGRTMSSFVQNFLAKLVTGEKRHLPVLRMFISITMLKLLMIISRSI
jgi:hypothetical protein